MWRHSATSHMTQRYGIDTSVLVRLLTGDPEEVYARTVVALGSLVEQERAEIYASNQVIGEAYVAVQHHYGVSKPEARAGLADVLRSGLVSPLNAGAAFTALQASAGAGLIDRLIVDDYARSGLEVLTLDRKMASLPKTRRL